MTDKPRLILVSPRPPRVDGRGDQRRALEIMAALSLDWDVEVVSWLPDVAQERRRSLRYVLPSIIRAGFLLFRIPAHAAYVQGSAPASVRRRLGETNDDLVLFITNRAVPISLPKRFVVDFIDDLGGSAMKMGESSRGTKAMIWRWEGKRLRRLDRRLVEAAAATIAHSSVDAAAIAPKVEVIPLSTGTALMPEIGGGNVVFIGNLFYEPNHEAAMWICMQLAPYLARSDFDPGRLVIAGRQPRTMLQKQAARAGVQLLPNVDDLAEVLRKAAVVLAPMALGAGAQYKIIDAVGAGRPCVISALANEGLGLIDGHSAFIREREAEAFGDAILLLVANAAVRRELAEAARRQLADVLPEAVAKAWRATLGRVLAEQGD